MGVALRGVGAFDGGWVGYRTRATAAWIVDYSLRG